MKPSRGFTLLEVVAALILMGSVLAGSILAFSRHRKQLANAEKRIEATMIADQLLQQLSSQPGGIPTNARGTIPQHPRWIWQDLGRGAHTFSHLAAGRGAFPHRRIR